MTSCLACHAETTNGLALCSICRYKVAAVLDFLPIYFRNLSRWRPARAETSRPVPGSRPPTGWNPTPAADADEETDKVNRALSEASAAITTWVGKLVYERTDLQVPDRDHEADTAADACALLADNLTTIANLDWAPTFITSITSHEDRLRRLTEQVAPGWYAGACRRCQAPTHVVPGLTWVKCGTCGVTTYARDHLDTILEESRDWVARPRLIADALVALVDAERSANRLYERIRKWGLRGPDHGGIRSTRAHDADGDETGPRLYRFGDVLDRLRTEGTTRTTDQTPTPPTNEETP